MTNPNNEPIKYLCEYCGSTNTKVHTPDCKLARIPWQFKDGRIMPSKNRMALAYLLDAMELYDQK